MGYSVLIPDLSPEERALALEFFHKPEVIAMVDDIRHLWLDFIKEKHQESA